MGERSWKVVLLLGLACTVVAAGAVAATIVYKATTSISSDPYSVQLQKSEVEPDTYAFGSTIVAAFQVGRFAGGGALNIGWATSHDNGKTWQHGFMPGITKYQGNGQYDRTSDASVAYDAKYNVWMVSSLAVYDSGGAQPFSPGLSVPAVVLNRSTDGGLTWQAPVYVFNEGHQGFVDKNWTTCDNWPTSPYYGNCYTEFDAPQSRNMIYMSTSTDGGLTWSSPQTTADVANGLGGQPLVQPNGTVVVPIGNGTLSGLQSFVSRDGGNTWSASQPITQIDSHAVANSLRAPPLPSAAVDATGRIYVAWSDCRFEANCSANDIVMTTSMDGINWTPVVRIPTEAVDSNVDHFLPALAVDRSTGGATAHLSLMYYYYPQADCAGTNCELRVATMQSTDGGVSWTKPIEISSHSVAWRTVPMTSQGPMVGDYMSSSFVDGGVALPVFGMSSLLADARINDAVGLVMDTTAQNLTSEFSRAFAWSRLEENQPRVFVKPEPVLSTRSNQFGKRWSYLF